MKKVMASVAVLFATVVGANLPAQATSTVFYEETFGSSWTAGSQWITTTGSSYTPQIVTDNAATPASALRLVPTATNQNSGLIYSGTQPMSKGLDVSFRQSQWGGTGADGMSFFLQKGTETSTNAGALGGALGYSSEFGVSRTGLPGGLIGVGLDRYGNFVTPTFGGSDCADSNPGRTQNSLTIRGPGNGTTGYCRLGTVSNSDTAWGTGTDSRAGRAKSVRIVVDPSTAAMPKVSVWVCAVAARCDTTTTPTLSVNAPAALLAEPTVRFGFAAGTGGITNNHEIWDLQVASTQTYPPVEITTESFIGGIRGVPFTQTLAATGVGHVTYALSASSLPAGLTIDSASGTVTGTPTRIGTTSFTIEATDSRQAGQTGNKSTKKFSILVKPVCTATNPTVVINEDDTATVRWDTGASSACITPTSYSASLSSSGVAAASTTGCDGVGPTSRACSTPTMRQGILYRMTILSNYGAVRELASAASEEFALPSRSNPLVLPPSNGSGSGPTVRQTVVAPRAGRVIQTVTIKVGSKTTTLAKSTLSIRDAGSYNVDTPITNPFAVIDSRIHRMIIGRGFTESRNPRLMTLKVKTVLTLSNGNSMTWINFFKAAFIRDTTLPATR